MKRSQEKTTNQTTAVNPPWASKVSKNLIARLYSTDAKGIMDEELIDEVGYGWLDHITLVLVPLQQDLGHAELNMPPQPLLKLDILLLMF